MPKTISSFEIPLDDRPRRQTLTSWLYAQLRSAVIDGRLRPGTRLPASRDFARQYGLSRGTVVSALERLQADGYVRSRVGSGTRVNRLEPAAGHAPHAAVPAYIRRAIASYARPKAWADLPATNGVRPFAMSHPDVAAFPAELWGRLASRRARNSRAWLQTDGDGRGLRTLRESVAAYLGTSRGVRCSPDQVVIVSGVQQALDLLSRLLLKPGDPVWMEDPGYFGAAFAFGNAGARIIPVPVDEQGLCVSAARRLSRNAKGVYVTPAHQFPLGMTMPLRRRMALLEWAAGAGAFVIEDDYDSEYRFDGPPVPAMQTLDRGSNVIFVGSFNKLLFPSLRIGYVVLPPSLVDVFLAFRYRTDFHNVSLDQATLSDFIADGHLGRHLRRMRDLYAGRLAALLDVGKRHLDGLLELSGVMAGLYTAGRLKNGMSSRQAEAAAAAYGVEVVALDRYTLRSADPKGVLLGFAAFDEAAIRASVTRLAAALGG